MTLEGIPRQIRGEGGKCMEQQKVLFSNKELKNMIIPLFLEQLLVMLVGMADTVVVSYVGEAASQLLSFSTLFAAAVALLVLIGNEKILGLMFGRVESDVMAACITYLRISVYSYPALAVYNAGAAIYRSIGKTSVTMYLSVVSNIINVIGNIIGVFVLKAGVAGVAYPSLIARTFSAVAITMLCFGKQNEVFYRSRWIFAWNGGLMKSILKIAVPNGFENGVFQLVKVALSSIVALFGTY